MMFSVIASYTTVVILICLFDRSRRHFYDGIALFALLVAAGLINAN